MISFDRILDALSTNKVFVNGILVIGDCFKCENSIVISVDELYNNLSPNNILINLSDSDLSEYSSIMRNFDVIYTKFGSFLTSCGFAMVDDCIYVKKYRLSFDIGANIGDTVETLLKKSDKVVAFEPNPDLVTRLSKRFKDKVIVDNRALSSSISTKVFSISNAHTISTLSDDWIKKSRFSNNYNWNRKINVQTTTLDSIINEYGVPDFVKIDVEGHEYDVFNGLSLLLPDTIFAFEWAEEEYDKLLMTHDRLSHLGYNNYSFTYKDDLSFFPLWQKWDSLLLHSDINTNRKEKWGMIYFKK